MSNSRPIDTGILIRTGLLVVAMICLLGISACIPPWNTVKEEPVVLDSRTPDITPTPKPLMRCRVQPRTPCILD